MTLRICEHVKANGSFCKSPALRGRDFCFFHLNCLGRKLQRQQAAQHGESAPLELPPLENADAIQVALMQVTQAILDGRLDSKRAGLVLYALQTASTNLHYTSFEAVEERDTVCDEYPSLEEDYQIAEYALVMSPADDSQEEEAEDEADQDNDGRPYVGSYTAEDMAEARNTIALAGDPPPEDEPEPYSEVSDPELLRKELRVAWAYIHRMEERHRKQLAQRLAKDKDTVTVFGKSARRQSLLFSLKKPPQSAEIATLAQDRQTQAG